MKCPHCQAQMLPVDGVMFCLQCGLAVAPEKSQNTDAPPIEETADPLLQKAITDSLGHNVKWKLPVSGAPQREVKSFASMHQVLAPPRPLTPAVAGGPAAAVLAPATPLHVPTEVKRPGPEPEIKHGVGALNLLPIRQLRTFNWLSLVRLPGLGWSIGLLVAGVFVLGNLAIYGYFNDRVYPGVKVGALNVGGVKQADLARVLQEKVPANSTLTVTVGGASYELDGRILGTADLPRAQREAMNVGHNIELPLAGLISALLSKPVVIQRGVDETAVNTAAQQLATQIDHKASEPVPVIVGSQAFVISEKSGEELNVKQAEASISQALSQGKAELSMPAVASPPLLSAAAYQDDVAAAQSRMALSISVSVGGSSYTPSPQQIGSWLVFAGAGKGVSVNQSAVAAYVAAIPGRFDRLGAFNALVTAVGGGHGLTYAASTSRVTGSPKPANTAPGWPLATYQYCIAAAGGKNGELSAAVANTLADPAGWSLSGRVKFVPVASGCNFTISLVPAGSMGQLDQRCNKQSTCRAGNQLEINLDGWTRPPAAWTAGLAGYRTELINHEVGHWLGFNHSGCLDQKQSTSVLQSPTLVLNGCSPDWYAVSSSQADKVLPGF